VPKDAFVASATAVGLIVDGARMPVYFVTARHEMTGILAPILIATGGVIAGTLVGRRALAWIPESRFRTIVALLVGILGVAMLIKGLRHS
jgi:uncharacterized membrane protein YfcA